MGLKEKITIALFILAAVAGLLYARSRRKGLQAVASQQADLSSALGTELQLGSSYGQFSDGAGNQSLPGTAQPGTDLSTQGYVPYNDPSLDNVISQLSNNYQTYNQQPVQGHLDTITPVSQSPASSASQAASLQLAAIAPIFVQAVSSPITNATFTPAPATASGGYAVSSAAVQQVQQQGLPGGVFSPSLRTALTGTPLPAPHNNVMLPLTPVSATSQPSSPSVTSIAGNHIITPGGRLIRVN